MSDDTRSSTNVSSKSRKPARPRILVVNNPGPDSSSESEETKQNSSSHKPDYRRRPLPSPGRGAAVERPQPPTGRGPLPPPLTTDIPDQGRGYQSTPSNPALSSPSSTSSPAVESTPPPSTPGQSAPPIDLLGEGTLRPEMVALPSDRNDAVCQRSAQIVDAFKSPFSRRPHVRRSSQNSRPSSSPTSSTPDAYTPHSQVQPTSSASDSYSAHPPFQPGTSAPSFYMPHHFPKVAEKPIEKVALLVTTNTEEFIIVDASGAMTGPFIRERIFAKLQVSDEAQPNYSIYRTEVSKFAIGDALTDEELFNLCRQQGDETGTLKLLVSHSSAFVHEPPHEQDPDMSMDHPIPPPTLPQHDLVPKPRRPRSRSRHGSQSSASERVPTEDPGYEPSVSDDLNNGDRDARKPTAPLAHPPMQKVSQGAESPIVRADIPPRSEYSSIASHPSYPHGRYDSSSRWSPSMTHDQDDFTLVRHRQVAASDANDSSESPVSRNDARREHPRDERLRRKDESTKKARPRTPQDGLSPPHHGNGVHSPFFPPRTLVPGGMNDHKGKKKNKSQVPIPKSYLVSGTYDTPRTAPRLLGMKSHPNLRVAAQQVPPSLMPGTRHGKIHPQPPLPSTSSRPSTSGELGSATYADVDRDLSRRMHDLRRGGMSPATPSTRTVTSPPYGNTPGASTSHLTPTSPPATEPFPRPRSAQDRGNLSNHPTMVSPNDDRSTARPGRPPHIPPHLMTSPSGTVAREDAFLATSPRERPTPSMRPTPPRSPYGPYNSHHSPELYPRPAVDRGMPGDRTTSESTVLRAEREVWAKLVNDSEDGTVKPSKIMRSSMRRAANRSLTSSESDSDEGDFFMNPGNVQKPPPTADVPSPPGNYDTSRTPPANFPAPPDHHPPPFPTQTSRRPYPHVDTSGNKDIRRSTFDDNVEWAPRPPPEAVLERMDVFFPAHDLDRPVIEMPSGGTSPITTENPIPAPQRNKHKKSIRVVAAELKKRASRMETSIPAALRKRNTKLWGSKVEEVTTEAEVPPIPSEASPGGVVRPIFRWIRGELIGKGTYGKVYLALNATTGEMIAVKQVEIPRTASDISDTRQVTVVEALKLESETLKDLDHPNIVQYLGFEETPAFLSIFLEYVPGGSIASCLRRYGKFEEEVTKSFMGQILSGLEYLHGKGILHRDLKADNILVETNGICKISDFGISKRTDDVNQAGAYTSMQGTVFWMAPEVINSQKGGYNSKVDIWSVGCVVYEMWTGQRPWNGQEAMAVLLHLYQNRVAPPLPESITLSPLADDFRQSCFAMDPNLRPSAAELRQHPYLELQPGWEFPGFQ